jgi:signal transduction histidine kinase
MDATETTIYQAVVIACIVLGIIMCYFFISVIWQQREVLFLQKQSILREIAGLEKERARIAADLHDELGPVLASVKMRINSFELMDPNDSEELNKTNEQIDRVISRMRQISYNLMPDALLKRGLVKALKEYIEFLEKPNDMEFICKHNGHFVLSEEKAINMYRIVQEVIHNSIKHSQATSVRIEIKRTEKKLLLSATDNGIGFDYQKAIGEKSGIGLGSISNRTKMSGGKMYLKSFKDKGTEYLFEIPLMP